MIKIDKKVIILAILIRLLIVPFFYHPDIKSQHFHFQFLSQGISNIYEYIDQNKNNLPYRDTFNYLPLTYYTFGSYQTLIKPILGDNFYLWLNDWGENKNNNPNIVFYMLFLKIPYIFLDLGIGYILLKIYKKNNLFYFWLFNPVSLYLIYILGNFDILPTFLTVLAFYFLKNKSFVFSYLSIGIAIALKMYPVMFLPFFLFYNKKDFPKNIKFLFISSIPLIISVFPLLFQNSFYASFLGSGLTQKILEYKISDIPIFPIIYLIILINFFISKSLYKFENAILQIFLTFIGLVNFHPQWIMWFFPFLLVIYIQSQKFKYFLISFFILILFYIASLNDNYLFWGHLLPVSPHFVNLTSPYQFIKDKYFINPAIIQQYIHNLLLIIGIIGSFYYVRKK